MSQVRNVQLTITDQGNDEWRVAVSYEARFTTTEVRNTLRFIERITLFGQDQILNGINQFEELQVFSTGVRASSRVQAMNRAFTVDSETLDEDNGSQVVIITIPEISNFNNPTDEVLAQVELIPFGISSGQGRSAVVRDNF